MTKIIQHEKYGHISYEESFWTGRKALTINGTRLAKIDKTRFSYTENGENVTVALKGNVMIGVTATINGETIVLSPKPEWYVFTLSILMFVFVLVWGNSPALRSIFPLIGGALGGLISALFATTNVLVAANIKKPILKVLVGIGFFAATLVACYIAAVSILVMLGA